MSRIIKYNGQKPADSKRTQGAAGTIGIPTSSGSSTSTPATLSRIIWGQIDNGSDLNGNILVNGNGYVLDDISNDPRNLEDLEYIFGDSNHGNLYVEKGLQADSGTFGKIDSSIMNASTGTINRLTSEEILTKTVNASTGTIQDLNGKELSFDKGYIKELLSTEITTDYLTVTKLAHFFELQIDKLRSVGGSIILSPADGFTVDYVVHAGNSWRLLYRSEQEGKRVENQFIEGDLVRCQSFNACEGTSYNVSNKYYWALVTDSGTTTMNGTGEDLEYHWIALSMTDYDGQLNPEVGDEIVHLGHKYDSNPDRQTAIVISSYTNIEEAYWTDKDGKQVERLKAPFICQYRGINNFQLIPHRWTYWAANGNTIRGNLLVESGESVEDVATKILSVDIEYAVGDSQTNPPTGGWSTSIPEVAPEKYLWTRTTTNYSNGLSSVVYTVSRQGKDGDAGPEGKDGKDGKDGNNYSPNMLTGTRDFSGDNWVNRNLWTKETEKYQGLDVYSRSATSNGIYQLCQIEAGKSYTFSCNVKSDDNADVRIYFSSIGGSTATVTPQTAQDVPESAEWTRVARKFTCTKSGTVGCRVYKANTAGGKIYVCGYKLEEGDVAENTVWTPALSEMIGVSYNLVPNFEYALVTTDSYLKVQFNYNLVKKVGDNIIPVNLSDEGLECYWCSDLDWGDYHYFSDNTSNLVYKNDDFLHDRYGVRRDFDPDEFKVVLAKKSTGEIIETHIIPVQFEAYAILSITDGIRTEVRNNTGKISQMEQTAEQFRFDIYDPDGEVGSRLEIATDKIMQRVEDNYTELSSRGFEINANTVVNGSLILNDNTQGFIIEGSIGKTQIAPQSIGTYENFVASNSRDYTVVMSNSSTVGDNTKAFVFNNSSNIGYIESGIQIRFTKIDYIVRRGGIGSAVSMGNARVELYREGYQVASTIVAGTGSKDFLNYTTTQSGNYSISVTANATFIDSYTTNLVEHKITVSYNLPTSSQLYNLIGFDGIGMSYKNHYQFFGPESTYLSYGDHSLKISNNGIEKYVGSANTIQQNNGSIIDSCYSYYINNYAPIQGCAIRIITSSGTTYLQDKDEVILIYDLTDPVTINLGGAYQSRGKRITVRKIFTAPAVTLTSSSDIYPLSSPNPVRNLNVGASASVTLVADRLHWIVI